MARLPVPSKVIRGFQYVLENDFTGGLKTEYTGLNFPENACTSTQNCTFFHTGSVFRRNGFDYEANFALASIDRTNAALSTFIWTNAGGDGNTKIEVVQVGALLFFYQITNVTTTSPLSKTQLSSVIGLNNFVPSGSPSLPLSTECQYTSGNGYLFVFHPGLEPFYCTYINGTITASSIIIKIRDFVGIPETIADDYRPASLTAEHQYNILNQGWALGAPWTATSTTANVFTNNIAPNAQPGNQQYQIQTGLPVVVSSNVNIFVTGNIQPPQGSIFSGSNTQSFCMGAQIIAYNSSTGIITVTPYATNTNNPFFMNQNFANWTFIPISVGNINTWLSATGVYPSNSDVWWQYKDTTGTFSPSTTLGHVTLGGPAPKGHFILNAFQQSRQIASNTSGLTDITTSVRPKTGVWFQGRVFYAGVDASFAASGDEPYTTWTENIYFSQIVTSPLQFGKCYQTNDPTDETFFDVLPSDGGVITIQGSGSIFKLFPITNGLLVFATNGVWFITGSTGIGFTATDYTLSKLSAIQSISSTSYVDILGYPMFWNEEGIYTVGIEAQQQGLSINSITLNTIKQFYDTIPKQSKKFARGSYNPITGQVQWVYRSTNESTVTDRYQFDSVLTFSMFTQSFYPWTISLPAPGGPYIHDVQYITYTGGSSSPTPSFKYLTSTPTNNLWFMTFSEERDNTNWKDWFSTGTPIDYTSFFVTGYRLHGDAQRKWQVGYAYIYSDNAVNTSYKFQGHWDYSLSGNSGKFTTEQLVVNTVNTNNFGKVRRRHKLRGRGTVLQLQISSVSGKPFKIDGWSLWEMQNASV